MTSQDSVLAGGLSTKKAESYYCNFGLIFHHFCLKIWQKNERMLNLSQPRTSWCPISFVKIKLMCLFNLCCFTYRLTSIAIRYTMDHNIGRPHTFLSPEQKIYLFNLTCSYSLSQYYCRLNRF